MANTKELIKRIREKIKADLLLLLLLLCIQITKDTLFHGVWRQNSFILLLWDTLQGHLSSIGCELHTAMF